MTAMSPRTTVRLRSTSVLEGRPPRREMSHLQRRAIASGITVKAGPVTEARLHRGIVQVNWTPRTV